MNKPIILFESFPDFTGSSLELYNNLISKHFDLKYDLLWAVDGRTCNNENKNFKTINYFDKNNVERKKIQENVKIIIDSNRYIYKLNNNIFRLHVRHGTNLKKCLEYSNKIGDLDALLTLSERMKNIDKKIYPKNIAEKIVVLGIPNNDKIYQKINLYESGFLKNLTKTENKYNKIFGWFPTYRQHRNAKQLCTPDIFNYGIPCVKTENDLKRINEILKKNNSLLIIQYHSAQLKNFKDIKNFSNIFIIDDSFLKKFNITLMNLITNLDALITDYSSIYFEYLLLNRPIALCVEDLINFNKKFGFWYNYLEIVKGEYCIDINSLCNFIISVIANKDNKKNERNKILEEIHDFKDNKSTERVVEFLIKRNIL